MVSQEQSLAGDASSESWLADLLYEPDLREEWFRQQHIQLLNATEGMEVVLYRIV